MNTMVAALALLLLAAGGPVLAQTMIQPQAPLSGYYGANPNSPPRQSDPSLDNAEISGLATWKTISLGTYTSRIAMFDALDRSHIHIGDLAEEVLHRPAFTISKDKMEVQLVVLSVKQLSSRKQSSLGAIFARARKLGYELCPPEVAVQLRLQYDDQPIGEFLDIAMEPIATYEGELVGLSVISGGAGLLLVGQSLSLDTIPNPGARFVFARPTQIAAP
jgi:hypothetical protein